jgi:murein DD-endopeptidase MepM/ murein hydrolase activator NlpD
MKPPILLAALLLLPATVASPGTAFHYRALPYGAAPGAGPATPAAVQPPLHVKPVQPPAAQVQPGPARVAVGELGHTVSGGRPATRPSWQWPLAPRPPVLRGFDPPPKPWLSGHRGVDLGFAGAGAQVLSPAAGTVSFSGVVVDRPVITIDHGGGLRSSFEPVESTLAAGDAVAAGQVIGTVVPGHCPPAQCLHWGVRDGEQYVNPLQFVLDLRPSILLPLPAP